MPRYSFEFFPPKTAKGEEKLIDVRNELNALNPDFFSVTYGAGGSTRDNTKNIVKGIREAGISVAPHLSFGGDSKDEIKALVSDYRDAGIDRIVALRGDIPSGSGITRLVYAAELVAFLREHFGEHFTLEVAAYPEVHPDAPSYDKDIGYLKAKFDAGADSGLTQYFYSADAYFFFMEACQKAGITKPIYPGIMPITNYTNLARFSRNCGAEIPRWLAHKLDGYGDDLDSVKACGTEVVTKLCQQLMDAGAPGLHFYTMNQVEPVKSIWKNLGL